MRSQRATNWVSITAPIIVLLAILIFAVYGVTRPDPPPVGAAATLQPAIVMSYGLAPPGFGDSCGGVAVVRLKNGEAVRAAASLNVYLQPGTRVTVSQHRSTCPPAPYTIWRAGPSSSAVARAPFIARH